MNLSKHDLLQAVKILGIALAVGVGASIVSAAPWVGPTAAPPADNVEPPINTSNVGQIKVGGLTLNTGAAANGLIVPFGKVLLGTSNDPLPNESASSVIIGNGAGNRNLVINTGSGAAANDFGDVYFLRNGVGSWAIGQETKPGGIAKPRFYIWDGGANTDRYALTIEDSTHNVGLSLPWNRYPESRLHIMGKGANPDGTSNTRILLENELGNQWFMNVYSAANKFAIGRAGAVELTWPGPDIFIDSAGNVGMGLAAVNSALKLGVNGKVGATAYCDLNGANCSTPGGGGGGGMNAPNYDSGWVARVGGATVFTHNLNLQPNTPGSDDYKATIQVWAKGGSFGTSIYSDCWFYEDLSGKHHGCRHKMGDSSNSNKANALTVTNATDGGNVAGYYRVMIWKW